MFLQLLPAALKRAVLTALIQDPRGCSILVTVRIVHSGSPQASTVSNKVTPVHLQIQSTAARGVKHNLDGLNIQTEFGKQSPGP
jgi:hypothetical protein